MAKSISASAATARTRSARLQEERDRVLALAIVLAIEWYGSQLGRKVLQQRVQPTGVPRLLLRDRRAGDRALERRRAHAPAREPVREEVLVVGDGDDEVRERGRLRAAIGQLEPGAHCPRPRRRE